MSDAENRYREFWDNYLGRDVASEDDLFRQVAFTIDKRPVPRSMLHRYVAIIVSKLELSDRDELMEFCCGNGLVTYELAKMARRVTGLDFAPRLIHTAKLRKSRENIVYIIAAATAPLSSLLDCNTFPNKFLMNNSLAYFDPTQLDTILSNILKHLGGRSFRLLLTGIPNVDFKWNFYDTQERRARHIENEKQPCNTNDGLGRWWRAQEIEDVCRKYQLAVEITDQPEDLSNYRMDALIASRPTA
jgi:SAM-dependent methyltransferase